jgi:hypothetical protein
VVCTWPLQLGDDVVEAPDESGRAGPVSKEALKQLHSRGLVGDGTWVWAAGLGAPRQFGSVRELRWMMSCGLGLMGPFEAALVSLQVMSKRDGGLDVQCAGPCCCR